MIEDGLVLDETILYSLFSEWKFLCNISFLIVTIYRFDIILNIVTYIITCIQVFFTLLFPVFYVVVMKSIGESIRIVIKMK